MKRLTLLAASAALVLPTTPALAAQNGTLGKYSRLSVRIKANQGFPSQCRPAILRAVQTWNAQGAKFQYSYATTNVGPSLENGNDNDLQFDYSTSVGSASVIAETRYRNNTTAGWSDADIFFNYNRMFYATSSGGSVGEFHCPAAAGSPVPSDKLDLESTSLHELGHAFGLDHFSSTTCSMYFSQSFGGSTRAPCAAEVTVFKSNYP